MLKLFRIALRLCRNCGYLLLCAAPMILGSASFAQTPQEDSAIKEVGTYRARGWVDPCLCEPDSSTCQKEIIKQIPFWMSQCPFDEAFFRRTISDLATCPEESRHETLEGLFFSIMPPERRMDVALAFPDQFAARVLPNCIRLSKEVGNIACKAIQKSKKQELLYALDQALSGAGDRKYYLMGILSRFKRYKKEYLMEIEKVAKEDKNDGARYNALEGLITADPMKARAVLDGCLEKGGCLEWGKPFLHLLKYDPRLMGDYLNSNTPGKRRIAAIGLSFLLQNRRATREEISPYLPWIKTIIKEPEKYYASNMNQYTLLPFFKRLYELEPNSKTFYCEGLSKYRLKESESASVEFLKAWIPCCDNDPNVLIAALEKELAKLDKAMDLGVIEQASKCSSEALIPIFIEILDKEEQVLGKTSSWTYAKDYLIKHANHAAKRAYGKFLSSHTEKRRQIYAEIMISSGWPRLMSEIANQYAKQKEILYSLLKEALLRPMSRLKSHYESINDPGKIHSYIHLFCMLKFAMERDKASLDIIKEMIVEKKDGDLLLALLMEKPIPELDQNIGTFMEDSTLLWDAGKYLIMRNNETTLKIIQDWVYSKEANKVSTKYWAAYFPDEFAKADTDGDGLSDSIESVLGSNPENPDTDGDGIADGQDRDPIISYMIHAENDLDRIKQAVLINHLGFQGEKDKYAQPIVIMAFKFPMPYYHGLIVQTKAAEDYIKKSKSLNEMVTTISVESKRQIGGAATVRYNRGKTYWNSSGEVELERHDDFWVVIKCFVLSEGVS